MKEPGEKTPGIHIWLLLWKASRTVEAYALRSVDTLGLGRTDFGILEALLHKGPLPVNTLGRKVLLTSGSMTTAVDRLERRGLVERREDTEDRRARIVYLTASGRSLIRKAFATHERDMEQAFSVLASAEREHLAGLLRKLGTSVEKGQIEWQTSRK